MTATPIISNTYICNLSEIHQPAGKYKVDISSSTKKGKCIQTIKIDGNGVEDTFQGPCVENLEQENRDGVLVIGNPTKNPFSLLIDEVNTLVIVKDEKCVKKTYITMGEKSTSSSTLDNKQCKQVQQKITKIFTKENDAVKGKSSII